MRNNSIVTKVLMGMALVCVLAEAAGFLQAWMAAEETKGSAVIRGTVRSTEGDSLYGILVKTRGEGKNYATSVFTDQRGNYEFPPLPFGSYQVSVGTDWKENVALGASGAKQDFSVKMGIGFMNQTTGTSWSRVIPGTEEEKAPLNYTCARCHTLWRIINGAPKSPDGWAAILKRMNSQDQLGRPASGDRLAGLMAKPEEIEKISQVLTKNIKPELKERYITEAVVRPAGEAARAVFTEWDLPHKLDYVTTATSDSRGIIWYVTGVSNSIGRLDPGTGEFQEWPYAVPNARLHDIMVDKGGNVWVTAALAGRVIKFDAKSYKYTDWAVPASFRSHGPHTGDFDADGNYWVTLSGPSVGKLDPRTGNFTEYLSPDPNGSSYGLVVDRKGAVWYTDNVGSKIGKVDASGKITLYNTPTPNADPRRIRLDSKGRLWFTEARTSNLGMVDTATGKITEYDTGIPGGYPYAIQVDKSDQVWFTLVNGTVWGRLDPQTKKFVYFLMPTPESYPRDGTFAYSTTPISLVYGFAQKAMLGRMYVR